MAKSLFLLAFLVLECALVGSNNVSYPDFGFELLMTKQEQLEHRLLEIQEESKQLSQNQTFIKRQISEAIEQQSTQYKFLENQVEMKEQKLQNAIRQLSEQSDKRWKTILEERVIKSCKEVMTAEGRFWLSGYGFEVFCSSGWTRIQVRHNGLVNFTRNWAEYKEGFGDLGGEFCLGLEKIHQLTSSKTYELWIHFTDLKGVTKYAQYDEFAIGNENENYVLKTIGGYSGDAGDSFSRHKGKMFSTYDNDNEHRCAQAFSSGWWHTTCSVCNLNLVITDVKSMTTKHNCPFKYSFMMIREKE